MKHEQLYSKLTKNRMDFLPVGEIEIKTIYNIVKSNYPDLCDDQVLCKDICTQGTNQPEWNHRVRSVLSRLKDQNFIEKSNRRGFWIVKRKSNSTPKAFDLSIGNASPHRHETITYRILRDTKLSQQIKRLHRNRCQICGKTIKLKSGKKYSEAHHIKPLGSDHGGPDMANNIVVLCPNHHVMCDYGTVELDISNIRLAEGHNISEKYIKYHNQKIYKNGV